MVENGVSGSAGLRIHFVVGEQTVGAREVGPVGQLPGADSCRDAPVLTRMLGDPTLSMANESIAAEGT